MPGYVTGNLDREVGFPPVALVVSPWLEDRSAGAMEAEPGAPERHEHLWLPQVLVCRYGFQPLQC
jgi:hypothetical protein